MNRWRRKPRVPLGLQPWPADAVNLTPERMRQLYRAGFAGCTHDPEEREKLFSSMAYPDGEAAASAFGIDGLGRGKLTLCYKAAYDNWTKAFPGPNQQTGSCVGHAGRICGVMLIGNEVANQTPDEVTGLLEGFPIITLEGQANGVIAWEPQYGMRGHSGQGANCDRLQRAMSEWGGMLLRKDYHELGIDLTDYQTNLAINWGRSQTPENLLAEGKKHQIRTATDCPDHEVGRDFLAAGYPLWVCSGYGFSNRRDRNGYSPRSGSWAHSWVIGGFDDRPIAYEEYGHPLALFFHDWGRDWNQGSRKIMGTDIEIPEGSMWIDARLLDNCDCTAMSSTNGWEAQRIESYAGGIWG